MKVLKCEVWFSCFFMIFVVLQSQELDEGEGGDFLFLSDNDEVAEEARASGKAKTTPDCEDNVLTSYLGSLQVINPESLITLAINNKLEKKCHNISKTVDHMESYLKSCNLEPEQQQYVKLLNGVKVLHKKLCTNDPYHKIFMGHKKCYGQLQTEVGDSCNGPADWSDGSDSKRVCRAYQEIKDCYYIKASILCGEQAAKTFKDLVQNIIESILTVNCVEQGAEEESPSKSKQLRLLKSQRLALRKGEEEEATASSQSLRSTGLYQLLTVLFVVFLANSMEM